MPDNTPRSIGGIGDIHVSEAARRAGDAMEELNTLQRQVEALDSVNRDACKHVRELTARFEDHVAPGLLGHTLT